MFTRSRSCGVYFEILCGTRYRSKTTSTKNRTTDASSRAEAIKRLNKENKSLFGNLLDRPTKRSAKVGVPRVEINATITSKSDNRTDGIQFELNKYKLKNHLKTEKTVDKESVSDDPAIPEQLFEITDDRPKASPNRTTAVNVTEPSGTSSVTAPADESPIPHTYRPKTPQLILPDIIIRNITSFPLLNELKETGPIPPPGERVLSIARDNKEYYSYPSVSRILNATMSDASKAALERWKKKMIDELGEQGFEEFYQGQLLRGSQFHSLIESYLHGTSAADLSVAAEMEGCWHSLSSAIPDIADVRAVESHVVHPSLMYRGVIDCVAQYKGKLSLIEWKKSDKRKADVASTYDAPLQMSAYLGALNYDAEYRFPLHNGVVVVAYTDGTPAQVFPMALTECKRHWGSWLRRLHQYWLQQQPTVQAAGSAL